MALQEVPGGGGGTSVKNPSLHQTSRAALCFGEPGRWEQGESREDPEPTLHPKTLTLDPILPAFTELHLPAICTCLLPVHQELHRQSQGSGPILLSGMYETLGKSEPWLPLLGGDDKAFPRESFCC